MVECPALVKNHGLYLELLDRTGLEVVLLARLGENVTTIHVN